MNVSYFLLIFCISSLIFKKILVKISGNSMAPTFHSGDIVLSKPIRKIRRYDIVIFKRKEKLFIKRVIGLPDESLRLSPKGVEINQRILYEPYLTEANRYYLRRPMECVIPKDSYFVLGDNRRSSVDSRTLGVIKREEIIVKIFSK
ncbi:signal peptidase I [Globicatella sp. PHS-GS-PNBC-21-1553]|uniref:signal peptidase I n=1 Tax=Globicatella sp. PHS-GS-PNBC-21-1553 TaxID=2885764 RepID=UPI00298EE887|nr:signal peptidase I [Globicatella sp. PHS-GS-PNBC-21-1553]WPC09755.1 signal peptidase I [Globicatella sp. PHS-GS-PNBC-21-1553]